MAEKFSDGRERSKERTESEHRAAKLFAGSIMALAGIVLVFDADEDDPDRAE